MVRLLFLCTILLNTIYILVIICDWYCIWLWNNCSYFGFSEYFLICSFAFRKIYLINSNSKFNKYLKSLVGIFFCFTMFSNVWCSILWRPNWYFILDIIIRSKMYSWWNLKVWFIPTSKVSNTFIKDIKGLYQSRV